MRNPKRTFLVGFIVGLLFFGWWFRGFLYINWRFGLFSWDSWAFLFQEINRGWRISGKGDWIFLFSFILSFPLYFILWYWADKIKWEKLIRKTSVFKKSPKNTVPVSTKVTVKEVKKMKAPPITAQRPLAMPSFGPTMRTAPISKERDFSSDMPFMAQPQPDFSNMPEKPQGAPATPPDMSSWESLGPDFQKMAEIPLSDIQLPQNQSVDEDIDDILNKNHWTHITDMILNGQKLNLAICQGQIALMSFDDEPGDWLADEEAFNDEDPLWFSETDHRTSPVFTLGILAKNLIQKLADLSFKVRPILIERRGNLINAEDMVKTWNDLGVTVCRTASGGPVQLKTFSEVFNKIETPVQESDLEKIKQILS